jgi:hypothetical protein
MIDLVNRHIEELKDMCRQYNVRQLELFGSAFTGENFDPQSSDIDFLVEFQPSDPPQHANNYFRFLEKLQDMFGCNIDLVERKAIKNPFLIDSIKNNKCQIYAA